MLRELGLLALAVFSAASVQPALAEDHYQVRTNWDRYGKGNLNVSAFVFRDSNRNGLYDLGDRPMSGVAVIAIGEGRTSTVESNSSGFSNFRMSGTDPEMEISVAGDFDFRVIVPPRWSITTGNETQRVVFEVRPGSPADMVALPPPTPIGLVPDLAVSGRLVPASGWSLTAISPPGEQVTLQPSASGAFSLAVEAGTWRLSAQIDGETAIERTIEIVNTPVQVATITSAEPDPPPAAPNRHLVTFDDLVSEGILKVPSGYGGLGWNNFVVTHQKFYDPEGYRNNAMSGEFLAYNGSGHPVSLTRSRPFDLVGGYFGASTLKAEGEVLLIKAWRGDVLAYEESVKLSALGPVYLDADFRGVTRVDFETAHYWQFTVDDITVAFAD